MMTIIRQAANEGAAVLLATHDPAIVHAYCNRLLFLSEGKLVLDAPVHQAFSLLQQLGETEYIPPHLNKLSTLREVP